jgi:hypothetical protein
VVEVSTRIADSRVILRTESECVVGAYISPDDPGITVTVTREALPSEPGMYWAEEGTFQKSAGRARSDGKRFFYRNMIGEWVDLGWGAPHPDDCPLIALVELPF